MRRPLHVSRGPIGGAHLSKINGRLPEGEEAGREKSFSPSAFNLNAVRMLKLRSSMSKKKAKLLGVQESYV
jgi:hypothetical protein